MHYVYMRLLVWEECITNNHPLSLVSCTKHSGFVKSKSIIPDMVFISRLSKTRNISTMKLMSSSHFACVLLLGET